jgi:thymidine phosphorylase
LRERAVTLAGLVLELVPETARGTGQAIAERILADGSALAKFEAICRAQGGMREPPVAPRTHVVTTVQGGTCTAIDNRRIARIAKLAGAPRAQVAGVDLHVKLGQRCGRGDPLYTVHAQARGELEYALNYAARHPDVVRLVDA